MEKSKLAQSLFKSINLFSDYIENGFEKNHEIYDFTNLDKINVVQPVKQIVNVENNENKIDSNIMKKRALIEVGSEILKCNKCEINSKIKVPGAGNENAKIFVISSFPDIEEGKVGRILVGENKDFFKKWFDAIKINFDELFITSLIKCRPEISKISRNSIETCLNHIDKQLLIIKPVIIIALGEIVLSSLCKKFMDLQKNHGTFFKYNDINLMAIYHPAEVIKNQNLKKIVWEDLKKLSSYYQENVLNAK